MCMWILFYNFCFSIFWFKMDGIRSTKNIKFSCIHVNHFLIVSIYFNIQKCCLVSTISNWKPLRISYEKSPIFLFFLNVFWWPSWSLFIDIYYIMMMVKCGTGQSSGSRIRRIRGSTAVRFSSYSWLFQDQVFVFLLSSLGRPLQAMRCGGRPVRFITVQESHRSA